MNSRDKIFKEHLIQKYLKKFTRDDIPDFETKWKIIKGWRKSCLEGNLNRTKETSIQSDFFVRIIDDILGYKTVTSKTGDIFNQHPEFKSVLDTSEADGALGYFSIKNRIKDVRVVVELKDAKTPLDKKQNRSSHLTPIEQAFTYANKNGSKCGWVIVSNFIETRLYKSNSMLEYETFDIRKMNQESEFVRFYFFLCKDNLINEMRNSLIDELYIENEVMGKSITNDFYKTYKTIRNDLYSSIKEKNPGKDELLLFTKTQKIMDRFTFICFCESCGLLPQHIFQHIVESAKTSFSFTSTKIWEELSGLFRAIDQGYPAMKINKYNGGLFRSDPELDSLVISNEVLEKFLQLSKYDFGSDLNVNILGQIFEQSILDVEQIKKEISGTVAESKGKRKDDGVFYTPYYVTRYIVEQTVGVFLKSKKEEIKHTIFRNGAFNAVVHKKSTNRKNTISIPAWVEIPEENNSMSEDQIMYRNAVIQLHLHYWTEYESILKNIKICDPACGSGAFLNQCFDYLYEEINFVLDMKRMFNEGRVTLFDIDKEILQNNLFGVDINPESVEITKLSLWLKTAKKNQTLASLDNNIKCGNSIIAEKSVVPNAFEWKTEFKEVFDNGGFDVIIGNPPYGATLEQVQKDYIISNYITTEYNFDTYKTFFELGLNILKENGYLGYITPNTFFTLEKGANKLRKFLFDNHILCKIVEVYNVFPDAIVEPVITVFKKQIPQNELFTSICVPRNTQLTSTFLSTGVLSDFLQMDLKKNPQYIFNYRSSEKEQVICKQMNSNPRLDTLFDVMTGAKPYQVGKGVPPQTRNIVDEKPYTGLIKKDDSWIPYMRGRSIGRYVNKWNGNKEYIQYGDWLAEPRSSEVFKGEKLFIRQTGDQLIATFDRGNVSNNTLHSIFPLETNKDIELYYLLGLLNSTLMNWYYRIVNYLELGKVMAEVKGIYVKKLPIAIGTPEARRSVVELVKRLLDLCQQKYNKKYTFINFIEKSCEPKKITERLEDFEMLSFREYVDELKKQKVKLTATQQMELLELFEKVTEEIGLIARQIQKVYALLDEKIYDLYNIPDDIRENINNQFMVEL